MLVASICGRFSTTLCCDPSVTRFSTILCYDPSVTVVNCDSSAMSQNHNTVTLHLRTLPDDSDRPEAVPPLILWISLTDPSCS